MTGNNGNRHLWNFNPRPLAGATDTTKGTAESTIISIHAPLRGRLPQETIPIQGVLYFNPRPLAGATHTDRHSFQGLQISIHAPLRGRRETGKGRRPGKDFNPRPLAGATSSQALTSSLDLFQSTPPCGGDLWHITHGEFTIQFQSTPPCGGDALASHQGAATFQFQSTPPCGGDHWWWTTKILRLDFNPRPLAGATTDRESCSCLRSHFNPRPLAGATWRLAYVRAGYHISIHAPLRGRQYRQQ